MKRILLISLCGLLFIYHPSYATSNTSDMDAIQIDIIANHLEIPWGMAVLPRGDLLITQRQGKLTRLNPDSGKKTAISGLPGDIFVGGQAGLFDVQLPPDYTKSQWIYFSYSKNINGQGAVTLARAKLNGNRLENWQDLLVTESTSTTLAHFGGRITFDDDNHIFLSVGERGIRPNAQNLANHAGSILRLNLDGSIPTDNPFVNIDGVKPEIWSYGHRNPQGLFYSHLTHQLWEVEHGPRGGDEINLIKKGKNYGWPVISYGMEYDRPFPVGKGTAQKGMEQPVYYYIPSIATSSIIQYSGKAFQDWKGNLFIGALKLQHLNRIVLDKNNSVIQQERLLADLNDRIRNVIESPEGWLYLGTDRGKIIRLKFKSLEKK